MNEPLFRVGELAGEVGVTVRTLHHWDRMGLLVPSRRTSAGHRLYGPGEVERLQQILSLRALGLSLKEIRAYLQDSSRTLVGVLRMHRDRVRKQVDQLNDLLTGLERLLDRIQRGETIPEDDLLRTMERMTMIEKYFTPEQMESLKARREALGEEEIREAEEAWPRLIAAVRKEMEKGTDPASPEVQELAAQWKALVKAFSGGDQGIETSVSTMYGAEPDFAAGQGLDADLFRYVAAAMKEGMSRG